MKKILLFCMVALAAFVFTSCEKEKEKEPPSVNITHSVSDDKTVTFEAFASEPVIMFYWWVYCDGIKAGEITGRGFADNDKNWHFIYMDAIKLQGESQKSYKAVLRYYDKEYNEYYAESGIADVP